jgi:hypothetical protein
MILKMQVTATSARNLTTTDKRKAKSTMSTRRATFAEPDGTDLIPVAVNMPLRLLEFRPQWEVHAMLRINRIPYRAEGLELPFSMDRPLPLLVHGGLVRASRSVVLEYAAGYKPRATQSTSAILAPEVQTAVAPTFCADESTVNVAYLEKVDSVLHHWRAVKGLDRRELFRSLPFVHACVMCWSADLAALFINTSPSWKLPDVTEENLLQRLDESYSSLSSYLQGLYDKYGFVGPLDSSAYTSAENVAAIAVPGSGGGSGVGAVPVRRSSLLMPASTLSSSSSSGKKDSPRLAAAVAYSASDAVAFAHLLAARLYPETAELVAKYPPLIAYFDSFVCKFFANTAPVLGAGPVGEDERDAWNVATAEVLRNNCFCSSVRERQEALRALLRFDPEVDRERREEKRDADRAAQMHAMFCSNEAPWLPMPPKLSISGTVWSATILAAAIAGIAVAVQRQR